MSICHTAVTFSPSPRPGEITYMLEMKCKWHPEGTASMSATMWVGLG